MIYNFKTGITANYLLNKLRAKFSADSEFILADLRGLPFEKIKIKNESYIYKNGEHEYYMFAYKHRFSTIHFNALPKYHITECETRETYNGYRFSHYMPVKIYCLDQRKSLGAINLELCKNCINNVTFFSYGDGNIEWFDVILNKTNERNYTNEDLRVDGYTRDWNHVSKAYRNKNNFTCENCGLNLKERRTEFFCETHHIDKNKLNNKIENLQCLCVKCHSEVDAGHKQNYSSGKNLEKLNSFLSYFD